MSSFALATRYGVGQVVESIASELANRSFGTKSSVSNDGALHRLRSLQTFTADIETDCHRFQRLLRPPALLSETRDLAGLKFPELNYPVPIEEGFRRLVVAQLQAQPDAHLKLTSLSPKEAIHGFCAGLTRFLKARTDSQLPPSALEGAAQRPMLAFRVHTQHHLGLVHVLRHHYPSNYWTFGSPTTHVDGYLDPGGGYSFMVEYVAGQPLLDPGIYDAPPKTEATLLY